MHHHDYSISSFYFTNISQPNTLDSQYAVDKCDLQNTLLRLEEIEIEIGRNVDLIVILFSTDRNSLAGFGLTLNWDGFKI